MKSLFKRAFATATSSVLVFSQLAATAVNTNAADQPLVVDKALALKVPFEDELDALTTYLDPIEVNEEETEATFAEGTETVNDLHSKWNDEFESAMLSVLGSKDSLTREQGTGKFKNAVKTALTKTKRLDEAEIDALVAAIADTATVVIDADGKATGTIALSNVGPTIGQISVEKLEKRGTDFKGNYPDWSSFVVAGTLIVEADYGDYDKTVDYPDRLVDQHGNKIRSAAGVRGKVPSR